MSSISINSTGANGGINMTSTVDIGTAVNALSANIRKEMERRSYLAANELRNASLEVLRGQRHGRRYRVPGTKRYYTASAPGEPPAVRTGIFRLSWKPTTYAGFGSYISRIETNYATKSGHNLGDILENGAGRIAARPHHERILQKAQRPIERIYGQPYLGG